MDTTAHPTLSGKSLSNLPANPYTLPLPSRTQPYKSWRKKYRKMRHNFDSTLEENKRLFKETHKLSSTAQRLREENDGLLDILLDLNASPSLPPHLRFNNERENYTLHVPAMEIPADITPEQANETFQTYKHAVQSGSLPAMDLQIIRHELDRKLAAQETVHIDQLAAQLPSLPVKAEVTSGVILSSDDPPTSDEPAYLTPEQESTYLSSLDARLGDNGSHNREAPTPLSTSEEKHFAEMTPRELERHVELLNPNSQHSWLAARQKLGILPGATAVEIGGPDNDNDSVVSHEPAAAAVKAPRKRVRKPKADGDLAKRVGDKAVERAREEGGDEKARASPSMAAGSGTNSTGLPDDEDATVGGGGGSARKKRDVDGGYHPKGGNTGKKGAGGGGKRKRSGEDVGGAGAGTPGGVGGRKF
ncbi:hypothetical protein LTR27_002129 [Elasticomyces elasticus]|nr:hypothetical protein LTR27_002129 [Elasticomyces elasticus]